MGIDKESSLNITVIIDNNKEMLKRLENNNKKFCGAEEHKKRPQLWFSEEDSSIIAEEYYFDEEDNNLFFTGNAQTSDGEIFVSIKLPVSDIILIDLLQHSIKKLNKLKTALETLK